MEAFATSTLAHVLPSMPVRLPIVEVIDISTYLMAFAIFCAITLLCKFVQYLVVSYVRRFSRATANTADDVVVDAITSIRTWVYMLFALYCALQLFTLPEFVDLGVRGIVFAALVWQTIEVLVRFIEYGTRRFVEKDLDHDGVVDPGAATASHMLKLLSRIVLWVLGIIFLLSNLGIEVTSLIAGLGIGGIAIAFALQGILADLFASFSIFFDRPFRVGDFISIGDHSGTVERIGIMTTRLRTLQGEELVVPNTELTSTRIQNYQRLAEWRVVAKIGITYETPYEKIEQVPELMNRILERIEGVRIDRIHFTTFGDFALEFEVVYYCESEVYKDMLDAQHIFNMKLMQRFHEENIEFAYPTQTIYTSKQVRDTQPHQLSEEQVKT